MSALLLPVAVAAGLLMAAPVAATESIPRACGDLSFKVIARSMDAAGTFQTRLVLLGKSLMQERSGQRPPGDQPATAADMEEVNVGTLRNALAEVWGYLMAAENLAAVRDLLIDDRDRFTADRQLNLVAQQIQEPLSFGMETAENAAVTSRHPAIAAEVSKIRSFLDETRAQFGACAGRAGR